MIWIIVRQLKKQQHELGDYVYRQNEISDNLYLIHTGIIRIYTEQTQHSLYEYVAGQYFGNCELFTNTYRLGSAFVTQDAQFYRINKFKLDNILLDYKDIKRELVLKAIKGNKEFLHKKTHMLEHDRKDPLYGVNTKMTLALEDISKVKSQLTVLEKEMRSGYVKKMNDDGEVEYSEHT